MTDVLSGHEPANLWKYFEAISAIPRESGNEKAAVDYIENLAKERGFEYKRDDANNICVKVPATKGYEDSPTVILQGHIDMVCVKTPESKHDFEKDGIKLKIDGEWLTADETTLGADNLTGVAAGLAILDEPDVIHGPLELLTTVDEEVGMTGAIKMSPDMITGQILLNLDSEDEQVIYIGCSGGGDCVMKFKTERKQELSSGHMWIRISGLTGGHSGLEIHKNTANAVKLLTRILYKAEELGIRLTSIKGGTKRNVVPSEAVATLFVPEDNIDDLVNIVNELEQMAQQEFGSSDPNMKFEIEKLHSDVTEYPVAMMEKEDSDSLVQLLMALPHGVIAMSRDMEGLVETSNNVGVVTDKGDHVEIIATHRSSVQAAKMHIRNQVTAAAELAGASIDIEHDYPGWKPNPNSKLLALAKKARMEKFNTEGIVKAIHAGLECGLLLEKKPDLDVISFGPDIEGAHSVEEKVHIKSVEKHFVLLKHLLEKIAKEY